MTGNPKMLNPMPEPPISPISDGYMCIECGEKVPTLYRNYVGGFVKLFHCKHCQEVCDKYVEYDWVIISLDMLLHKPQAYRHILFNSQIKSHWKPAILFLVFDAYSKWTQLKDHVHVGEDIFIFYAAMETSFYKMFLLSLSELASGFMLLFLSLFIFDKSMLKSFVDIMKGLTLSNFGKVFLVPAVIWAKNDASLYLALIRLLQLTSNAQALRVITRVTSPVSMLLSCTILAGESICRTLLFDLLQNIEQVR